MNKITENKPKNNQIILFKRGDNIQITKNFHLRELECHCGECEGTIVDLTFLLKLQKVRNLLGIPFKVNSFFRCEKHNKNIGGVLKSHHLIGRAGDLSFPGKKIFEVERHFEIFGGLGLYNTFIHVDNRKKKARWDYRGSK